MERHELVAFVGPTAHGTDRWALFPESVSVRPPVRRGGITELLQESPNPLPIAIVDGTFHSYPAVGHVEIRQAMEAGWQIWGLSSMGAIRAAEMHHMGMHGYGDVFHRYATDAAFDDDEVALIHGVDFPHMPLSEPLIHIRAYLDHLTASDQIRTSAAETVADVLKRRWYGERNLHEMRSLLLEHSPLTADEIDRHLKEFGRFRLKTLDLVRFMRQRPWRTEQAAKLLQPQRRLLTGYECWAQTTPMSSPPEK